MFLRSSPGLSFPKITQNKGKKPNILNIDCILQSRIQTSHIQTSMKREMEKMKLLTSLIWHYFWLASLQTSPHFLCPNTGLCNRNNSYICDTSKMFCISSYNLLNYLNIKSSTPTFQQKKKHLWEFSSKVLSWFIQHSFQIIIFFYLQLDELI